MGPPPRRARATRQPAVRPARFTNFPSKKVAPTRPPKEAAAPALPANPGRPVVEVGPAVQAEAGVKVKRPSTDRKTTLVPLHGFRAILPPPTTRAEEAEAKRAAQTLVAGTGRGRSLRVRQQVPPTPPIRVTPLPRPTSLCFA